MTNAADEAPKEITPTPAPLYHRGLWVPWVTKWSGETLMLTFVSMMRADGTIGLAYADRTPYDVRDGMLWQRDAIAPGSGVPLWSQVHTGRQRLAMTTRRCQVCGTPIDAPGEPVPWLLPADEHARIDRNGTLELTGTAPTCRNCWLTARSLCPHLRHRGAVECLVTATSPWGVYGQIFWPGRKEPTPPQLVPLAHARKVPIVAQQMLLTLTGITPAHT